MAIELLRNHFYLVCIEFFNQIELMDDFPLLVLVQLEDDKYVIW